MTDQLNYFLSRGLWSVVEALFNSPCQFTEEDRVSVEKWLLDIATHPNQSKFSSPTFQQSWQLSWLAASLILKLISSNSPEIKHMKWFTEQRLSRSDLEKLRKVSEFRGLISNLPEVTPMELKNELVQLYIRIISEDNVKSHSSSSSIPVKHLSSDADNYLKRCLLKDPLSTNSVIQRMLCLWSAHFVQSDNALQDIYEDVFRTLIQNIKDGKIEDNSKLLCLLTIFEVSEDKENRIVDHIFPHILNLCTEEKVPFSDVYLSLMGRGKYSLLRALVSMEEAEKKWKNSADENHMFQIKLLKSFVTNDSCINMREIFMRAYKRNVPWIDDVVSICVQAVLLQNIEAVRACLNVSGLKELWPLIFFDLWKQFIEYGKSNINLKAIIEECKSVVEDQTVLLKIYQMEHCLIFSEWIINSGAAKNDSISSVVEQVMNSCCAIHALKRTCKLCDLEEEYVMEALEKFRSDAVAPSKTLLQTEMCIFSGYYLVIKVYKAIISSMDLERTGGKNADDIQDAMENKYSENIKQKLNEVKDAISKLYPLPFRVEILEYIFSLLFLQHKDLHDENTSDSGGEDSDLAVEENPSTKNNQEGRPQFIRSISVVSDPSENASKENLPLKGTPLSSSSKSKGRFPSVDSRKNFFSTAEDNKRSSITSYYSGSDTYGRTPRRYHGPSLYICGPRVVKDLLQCLKDCLVDASVALFSSLAKVEGGVDNKSNEDYHRVPSTVTEDSVQKRMARLSHYVGEAACRFEIVTSERSSASNISTSYLHPFWHDLPGRVGKPIKRLITIELSDDSEEDGVSQPHTSVSTSKSSSFRKRKSSTFMSSSPAVAEMKPESKRLSNTEAEKSSESGSQSNKSEGGRRRLRRNVGSRRHKSSSLSETTSCGFCQPSKSSSLPPSFGIIDRMLASPKSLVIQCLSLGEIVKAKKVIEIFKLDETSLAYEAKFLEEYISLLHKLDKKTKEHKLGRTTLTSTQWSSPLQSVKRAASAGMLSTSFSSVVESFLTTVKPPIIEGLESVVTDYPQAAGYLSEIYSVESYSGHCKGYVAAIITDLALTYAGTSEHSMSLLEIALKHCPKKSQLENVDGTSLRLGRNSPYGRSGKFQSPSISSQTSGPVGFATFLHNAVGSLKILNERLQVEDSVWRYIEIPLFPKGKKMSMPDLISTLLPLNPSSMASCLSFWEELFRTVRDFRIIMSGDVSSEVDSVSSFKTSDQGRKRKVSVRELNMSSINGAFNAIISACCSTPWQSEAVRKPGRKRKTSSSKEVQYLQMLFSYLKTMSTLMIQSNLQGKGFPVPSCYFDVLNEGLDSIIGKLMFECDVNPSRLETIASKMNLDLISCIIRNCCPPIKILMPALECTDQLRRGYIKKEWGKVILNPVCEDWNGPCRPPSELVEQLLNELLKLLRQKVSKNQYSLLRTDVELAYQCQDIVNLLVEGTYELANVSMDLLPVGDESKSFFVNLCNLATLHAILFLECYCIQEKVDEVTKSSYYGLMSSNPSEKLLSRMSICYKVGSLGTISIHDMSQVCLGMELSIAICNSAAQKDLSCGNLKLNQFPFYTFPLHPSLIPSSLNLPSPDARLIFIITTGQSWCAKVAVLSHKVDMDLQLDSLINDYLTFNVRFDSVNPLSSIRVPYLLQLYCQSIYIPPSPECQVSSSADSSSLNSTTASSRDGSTSLDGRMSSQGGFLSSECVPGVLEFLTKFSKGQLKDDISILTARSSPGSIQDVPMKIIEADCSLYIHLDNQKMSDEETVESLDEDSDLTVNSKLEVDEWSWRGEELPSAVLEYLELRCWPLSTIAVLVNNSESSVFLPPIMSHASCLKRLLQGLLDYPPSQKRTDGIVALLSPEGLPSDRLWPNLDDVLFSIDQIPTQDMLGFLKMIPQPRLYEEPKLIIFHDMIMWKMASMDPVKDFEEPWKYCMQIRDPNVKVACLLCNINKWAVIKEGVCTEALFSLCGDKNVYCMIPDHTKKILLDTCHKVEIYEKIFVHVKSPLVSNWYDVYRISESDPGAVLHKLIQAKQVSLFLKWIEIHNLPEGIMCMTNHAFILMLTSSPPDFASAKKMLELVPLENAAQIIKESLPLLNSLTTIKFAISFLLENCKNTLSSEEYSVYEQWAIGLVMISHRLLLGKSNIKKQKKLNCGRLWTLLDIASNPLLILEQLIMNVQLEALDGVLALLKPHLHPGGSQASQENKRLRVGEVDRLLRQYAAKALEFRVCTGSVGREGSHFPHLKAPSPSFRMSASTSSLSLTGIGKGEKLLESLSSGSVQSLDLEFNMPAKVPSKAEWVPNDEVTVCMCCKLVSFSMFNRRHHCRRCGRVICGDCSTRRLQVEGYQGVPVRVCDDCHSATRCENQKVDGYGDLPVRVCDNCFSQSQNLKSEEDDVDHEEAEEVDEMDPDERLGNNVWWWKLSGDRAQDATVREEFSFEQSPSVSLCLAILKHHSPGDPAHPRLLLDSAENLLSLLRPSSDALKSLNPEVDHALVIHMVRSLAVASKVLYSRIGVSAGVERCDKVIGRAGLLNLLVRSGWAGAGVWAGALLEPNIGTPAILEDPRTGRSGSISKRRHHGLTGLRDQLVQEEQWELALEVATKGGLGRAGIWAAWGKACLRAGGWSNARQLFARCLQKGGRSIEGPPAGALATTSSSHLSEIIKILEDHNVALPVLLEDPPSYKSHPYPSVIHSLASLDAISKGIILLPPAPSRERPVGSGPALQEDVKEECLFYLKTYGTDQMVVDFLIRHGDIKAALLHFLNTRMSPELFLDEIYLRCLKMGWISELEAEIKAVDPTLEQWKPHLCCLCRLLERRGMLHLLYKVQVFAEDHVRAAITCIRFYCNDVTSYSQMRQNCVHLHNAQKHMEAELATVGWVAEVTPPQPVASTRSRIPPMGRKTSDGSIKRSNSDSSILPLKLDPKELDKHINTIRRQDEVAKFLGNCEPSGTPVAKLAAKLAEKSNKVKTLPTLFGSGVERVHLAVLAIICGKDVEEGFGIAFRIIQDYNLNAAGVFESAGKMLISEGRPKDLIHLVSCIHSSGISNCSSICDQVIQSCIQSLVKLLETGCDMAKSVEKDDDLSLENSGKNALTPLVDPLLKMISDPEIKISACITCGQLKNAYLLAVRIKSNKDVERIADAAEKSGQSTILRICQRRLELVKSAPGVKN